MLEGADSLEHWNLIWELRWSEGGDLETTLAAASVAGLAERAQRLQECET